MRARGRLLALVLIMLGHTLPALSQDQISKLSVSLVSVADGLTHPLMLTEPPDDTGRLFILDQTGQIWIVKPDGTRIREPFLNIQDRLVKLDEAYDERGLLGLAFHPDFDRNGRFFVFYTAPLRQEAMDNFDHTNHLSEFRVSTQNPNVADPGSEKVLLRIDHPYMNHNGGTVAFGPDGYLYLSLGDGGHRDDQDKHLVQGHVEDWYEVNAGGNGQDIENNLFGSILRIDVNSQTKEKPYAIPKDNPFKGVPGVLEEIYAYGLRNPYRFSFDMGGHNDLIVGDAGQNMFEEISVVKKGGNYGWNVYEGNHCFNAGSPTQPLPECPKTVGIGHPKEGDPLIMPVIEFRNSSHFKEQGLGLVVIGGYVYRGKAMQGNFGGKYLFGVWSRGEEHASQGGHKHLPGRLYVAEPKTEGSWPFEELQITNRPQGDLGMFLLSFGQDRDGEVYVLTADSRGPAGNTGKVFKLVEAAQ
ncbi:MAG: PQQ-dependent sugar dehydrogenase [Syntrophotaleaceae bacterium]